MLQSFKEKHFHLFSSFLEENYGIHYAKEKADMLHLKLRKLMEKNDIHSFDEYFHYVSGSSDHRHLTQFLDELTTHTTQFFRENSHFEYLSGNISKTLEDNRRIRCNGEIRVWCAACSTGEEAYTLAMVLRECLPEEINIKILATDISKKVVGAAIKGIYLPKIEDRTQRYYMNKYFSRVGDEYHASEHIKKLVTFRTFNLMDAFEFKNVFDIIFCRNVMIYFNSEVQTRLIEKMYQALASKGLLFIGHSEGLTNKKHRLNYLQPSIYYKD